MTEQVKTSEQEIADAGFEIALDEISLAPSRLEHARECYDECPEGFTRCVQRAQRFERPGGYLVTMLKRDQHLDPLYAEIDHRDKVTGWRFAHGSHSGTYIRDPEGRDVLPKGYDLTGYPE